MQEKQLPNPYMNISQDNIVENQLSNNDFANLSRIKDSNIDDNNTKLLQNTSHLNTTGSPKKEDLIRLLTPKQRNLETDVLMIKDILEEQDIREMKKIIYQSTYVPLPDNKYYNITLLNSNHLAAKSLNDLSKSNNDIYSMSEKQVNIKDLIREKGGLRSSISLFSRILKVSAKLKSNVFKIERNVNQTSIDQNNEHQSRVNERTIVSGGDVEILEYYNTAKKIKLNRISLMYQIRDKISGYIQSIRIKFLKKKSFSYYGEDEQIAIVKLENHLNQFRHEQVIVKGQENIEKLINIIQYSQETTIPIFKYNLLHKNIGFFSRLYFSSYIQHNKDSLLNKFLQKYNEKDEALYDLLKNAKSLLKDPSYLQLFLTRIKLTLISNFLSSHKHEQNFLLTTYFNSQKCSQYCKIKDFGRSIVQTVVYATNPMFTSDKSVFICLNIFSKKMRNTYSKLIFTIEDIQHLISKDFTPQVCLEKDKIIKMVYLICEKIVYFNSKQFPRFKLLLSNLNKNSKKCKYDLLNSFDPTPEPLALTKSILTNKTLLTPVLRSQKVIFTSVKKLVGHFTIVTVRRYDMLDYYSVEIYIPRSGRKWAASIYQSDLWRFSANFMENLFPFIYWDHQNVLEIIRSFKRERYNDFSKKYENDIVQYPQKYIEKINSLQQEHSKKFYTSTKYNTNTKFKYEKYYEQYSSHNLPQQNKKLTFQQNSEVEESNSKQQKKSIISLQNIDSVQQMNTFTRNSHQGKTTIGFTKSQDSSKENEKFLRSGTNRQMSILKNSKSFHAQNGEDEHANDQNSSSPHKQQRVSIQRSTLKKQQTFNEFLKEKKYVGTINPSQKSSKEILEEDGKKDPYYAQYVFQNQRKVSFDQFSYMSKPNQFLKLFEKNTLEATNVLELKVIIFHQFLKKEKYFQQTKNQLITNQTYFYEQQYQNVISSFVFIKIL